MTRARLALVSVLSLGLGCRPVEMKSPAPSSSAPSTPALAEDVPPGILALESLVDPEVDPCRSFSAYACAGWTARANADGRTGQGAWREAEMAERTFAAVEAWLTAKPGDGDEPDVPTLRRFFSTCVADTATTLVHHPALASFEAAIDQVHDPASFMRVSGQLLAHRIFGVFSHTLFPVDGGTYVPLVRAWGAERTLEGGPASEAARGRLTGVLEAYSPRRVSARVRAVWAFEDRLLMLRRDSSEDDTALHAATLSERPEARSLPWNTFVDGWGVSEHAAVRVFPAGYVDGLARMLAKTPASVLRDYLRWTLVDGLVQSLPARYADDPDWPPEVTCRSVLLDQAGLELARAAGPAILGAEGHARALRIEARIREELVGMLDESEWLDPRARALVRAKIEATILRLGHGQAWPEPLPAMGDDHLANVLALRHAAFARNVAPTSAEHRDRPWGDSGYMLFHATAWSDAYVPGINFSLGMLTSPVFDAERPLYLDVAALGMIAGHELMHLGDPADLEAMVENAGQDPSLARPLAEGAACLSQAYDAAGLPVEPSAPRLEIRETLADLGGLAAAYRVHQDLVARGEAPGGETLSAEQLFFVAAAQFFCDPITDPAALDTGRRRIDRAALAFAPFAEAFECEAPDPMAMAPACVHW